LSILVISINKRFLLYFAFNTVSLGSDNPVFLLRTKLLNDLLPEKISKLESSLSEINSESLSIFFYL